MSETVDFAEVCFCIPWEWYSKLNALAEDNGDDVNRLARVVFNIGYREAFRGTIKGM